MNITGVNCGTLNVWQVSQNWPIFRYVKNAGDMAGIHLRTHDLRRHAATYASRCGVPIEIVSKIILRHSNPSTTQMYLVKISDNEEMKWIENIYA